MSVFTPDGQMLTTLHIRVGSTYRKEFQWKTGKPPLPVDLTGWTGVSEFYFSDRDEEPVLRLTTENGGLKLTAEGRIILHIGFGADGTQKFAGKKSAVFDLELTDTSGTQYRRNLIGGRAQIYQERTKT